MYANRHFRRIQMNRRTFLASMSGLAALGATPTPAEGRAAKVKSTSNRPPRKVIVGTVMQSFWGQYPGLHNRLDQLAGIVDQMAAQAKRNTTAVSISRCCR